MNEEDDEYIQIAKKMFSQEQLDDVALRMKLTMFTPGRISDYVIFKVTKDDCDVFKRFQKENK